MPKTTDPIDRLRELEAAIPAAAEAASEARYTSQQRRAAVSAEVVAPFRGFADSIRFKRPDAVAPEDQVETLKKLTADFFAAVNEKGLVLMPVTSAANWALSPQDPSVDNDLRAAEQALSDATAALRKFERENDVTAIKAKAEADAIRDALAGDDPVAIRRALNGEVGVALTTDREPEPERRSLDESGTAEPTLRGLPIRRHAVAS